jgi:predicted outer membrane lipoprotein
MVLCGTAYPFFFACLPLGNAFLRYNITAAWYIVSVMVVAVGSGVAMSFTAIQLVLNDVCPAPEVLGSLNALALTIVSGLRAFCPALFASLFASSADSGILGGHLIWILMIVIAAAFGIVVRWTPEPHKDKNRKTNGGALETDHEETA